VRPKRRGGGSGEAVNTRNHVPQGGAGGDLRAGGAGTLGEIAVRDDKVAIP